jgi:hypothetical protein
MLLGRKNMEITGLALGDLESTQESLLRREINSNKNKSSMNSLVRLSIPF